MSKVMELIREARNEMRNYYELSKGWMGEALSEEERKEKERKAYVNAVTALEIVELRLASAMAILVFGRSF